MTGNQGWLPEVAPPEQRKRGPGIRRALLLVTAIIVFGALIAAFPDVRVERRAPGGWTGSWSPDGRWIAFLSNVPAATPDLWIMDAGGHNQRRLSTRGARLLWWLPDSRHLVIATWRTGRERWWKVDALTGAEQPIWGFLPGRAQSVTPSPDGRHLAYAMVEEKSRDLWVAASDGSGNRGVSQNFWVRSFTWAPDGRSVFFTVGRHLPVAIWEYDTQTRTLGQLYAGFVGMPAVSPDGLNIAFTVSVGGGAHDIVVVNAKTRSKRSLAVTDADRGRVAWSPDGRAIAFSARKREGRVVKVLPVAGGIARQVTPGGIQATSPAWSPDGKRLLVEGVAAGTAASDLYAVNAWGIGLSRLTRGTASEWKPVWSPEGGRLAYLSDAGGQIRAWLLEDGRRTPIGAPVYAGVNLSWAPDGKRLLLAGRDIRILSLDGTASAVIPSSDELIYAAWAPGGSQIVYTTWSAGRPTVRVLDPHRRTDKVMVAGASDASWSPDGRLLAFAKGGELWISRADGTDAQRLATASPWARTVRPPVWSADGSKLVLETVERGEVPTYRIWLIDIKTARRAQLFMARIGTEFGAFVHQLTTPPVLTDRQVLFSWEYQGRPAVWAVSPGEPPRVLRSQASSPSVAKGRLAYVSFMDTQRVVTEEVALP